LVETLRYKPEVSTPYGLIYGLIGMFNLNPHYGPRIDSVSKRNEYLGVKRGR
jgi:hypothetical protein